MLDLTIENGTVVTPTETYEACIGVRDGKIDSISKLPTLPSDSSIDASGLIVFPGFIDAHVHFREPAGPSDESFHSGTSAAAAGGITAVFEMTGSKPSVLTLEDLHVKQRIASRNAHVDYALFGGAGIQNINKIEELAAGGIIGYKTYMTHGPECSAEDDATLLRVLEKVSPTKLTAAIHAEVASLALYISQKLSSEGKRLPRFHPESRPNFVESLAISRAIELANLVRAKCHIVHLSTTEGCEIISQAKKRNYNLTTETCPHYLLLTEDAMKKQGPYAKVNPPLRGKKDQEALWNAIRAGIIDFIASDHAPHQPESKELGWDDIWKAGAGTPGLDTMVPLMLTKANEGLLSFNDIARVMSEAPARTYNLFPRIGAIRLGSDANFTLMDRKVSYRLNKDKMYSKAAFATLYDGWRVTAMPKYTIVRGQVVAIDREIQVQAGFGKPLVSF